VAPTVRALVDGPAKSRREVRRNRRHFDGAVEDPDSEQPEVVGKLPEQPQEHRRSGNAIKLFFYVAHADAKKLERLFFSDWSDICN
jgi:hypothetical protein